MLAHKIRKFSLESLFIAHNFKKLLEKIVIFLRNNLVSMDKFDTFAPDKAENMSLNNMNNKNSESCIGCQLYEQCGSVCETVDNGTTSVWGKLLLPCALLIAVTLMVVVSYLINLMF